MSFGFDKGAELPTVPVYMELLKDVRTPEDVATLIAMYEGDVAERDTFIARQEASGNPVRYREEKEKLIIMGDGSVVTAGLANVILSQEASGCYRNGRRA